MGMSHRSPRQYERKHIISHHAIERIREYGNSLAQDAEGVDLGNLLDSIIVEGLPTAPVYHTSDGVRYVIPFEKPLWADPGLVLLLGDATDGRHCKVLKTLLTTSGLRRAMFSRSFKLATDSPGSLDIEPLSGEAPEIPDSEEELPAPRKLQVPSPEPKLDKSPEMAFRMVCRISGDVVVSVKYVPPQHVSGVVMDLLRQGVPLAQIVVLKPVGVPKLTIDLGE